jgi:hypothetical protein
MEPVPDRFSDANVAALIAPIHYFRRISEDAPLEVYAMDAMDDSTQIATQKHRSIDAVVGNWLNNDDPKKEVLEANAQIIRELARLCERRVPDKAEALSMAHLKEYADRIISK